MANISIMAAGKMGGAISAIASAGVNRVRALARHAEKIAPIATNCPGQYELPHAGQSRLGYDADCIQIQPLSPNRQRRSL